MSTKHGSHWVEREDVGPVTVVRLKMPKILDHDTTRTAFEQLFSLVDDVGRSNLVLSLGAIEFLTSIGLGKLIILRQKVQVGNGRLALCELLPGVHQFLATTHLDELFSIYATEQDAVRSFS